MSRKYCSRYAGARGKADAKLLKSAGSAYVAMPKMDGIYCHLHLDHTGRVSRVTSRTGLEIGPALAGDVLGLVAGAAGQVLAAELMAHTDRALREVSELGCRRAYVFDLVHDPGARVEELGFADRRGRLMIARADAEDRQDLVRGRAWTKERRSGRFAGDRRIQELLPVVPIMAPKKAYAELWGRALAGEIEGVVLAAKRAKIRDRGAKRKVKPTHTIDALVLASDDKRTVCHYLGRTFTVPTSKKAVVAGTLVEVTHEGWDAGAPRFARMTRVRGDLSERLQDCLS